MADDSKDAVTGLNGLPATVVKLGAIGTIVFLFAWQIMYEGPRRGDRAMEHADKASQEIRDLREAMIEGQVTAHKSQERIAKATEKTAAVIADKK